jgi:hypothetical protein
MKSIISVDVATQPWIVIDMTTTCFKENLKLMAIFLYDNLATQSPYQTNISI